MNIVSTIKTGARALKGTLIKESPTILTGIGAFGVVATTALGIKATPTAMTLIYQAEDGDIEGYDWPLTKLDKLKLVWKLYLPTAAMGAVSIACIIGANSINLQRNAALASLYALTDLTLNEYQEKVKQMIGEKKEEKIRDELSQDKLNRDPVEEEKVIVTGKGKVLFYESLSGRYFYSEMESVRKAVNDFNELAIGEQYALLNDFYDYLGLEGTELGKHTGWEANSIMKIHYSAKIATNNEPCIVIEHQRLPTKL